MAVVGACPASELGLFTKNSLAGQAPTAVIRGQGVVPEALCSTCLQQCLQVGLFFRQFLPRLFELFPPLFDIVLVAFPDGGIQVGLAFGDFPPCFVDGAAGVVDQALIGAAVPQRVQSPLQPPGLVLAPVRARFPLLTFRFGDLLPAQRLVGENGGRQSGVQDNQGSGQGEKRWFRHGANPFG